LHVTFCAIPFSPPAQTQSESSTLTRTAAADVSAALAAPAPAVCPGLSSVFALPPPPPPPPPLLLLLLLLLLLTIAALTFAAMTAYPFGDGWQLSQVTGHVSVPCL